MKSVLFFIFYMSTLYADGSFKFIKGDILLNGKIAKKSDKILFGDTVSSTKNSLAVISIRKSILKIKANSQIVIESPKKTKSKTTIFSIVKGEIFIKANKTKTSRYQVKTKNVSFGVRGTEFFVSYNPKKKNTWMCVNEGSVAVKVVKTKGEVVVKEGQGVVINSDKLPEVKSYEWTKKLNWKLSGNYDELNDKTDIQNISYDIENLEYD